MNDRSRFASPLIKMLAGLYLAFGAASAILLLWLLLRLATYAFGIEEPVVPPPPMIALVAAVLLMLGTKIIAALVWRGRHRSPDE